MVRPDPDMICSFFLTPLISNIVTKTHPSHLKATVSPVSQLISLSPSVCPSAFPLLASMHPSCSCPPPSPLPPPPTSPQAQPLLRYSQSHLQSDIFSGLITLSSHGLIEHLTSPPPPPQAHRCSLPHLHSLAGAF